MNSIKITLVLAFLLLAGGILCANEIDNDGNTADETDADTLIITFPKNVITIDVGQAASLLLLTGMINSSDMFFFTCGVAAQYERQITKKASVAGQFEYRIMEILDEWRMQAFSADVHGRYYPTKKNTFFLGGSLGYAAVLYDFSTPEQEIKSIAHYAKIGGKLGWRIDFKKPGGLVLEPALGLNIVFGTRIKTGYEKDDDSIFGVLLGGLLNSTYDFLARWALAGGFRFSLGLGYRF